MSFEQHTASAASENPDYWMELFLTRELARQRDACVASLRNVGLLEEIFSEQENDLVVEVQEGITGMDGKKYKLPSAEKITEHFSAEKYREKIEQGFTKLLIVPFGYPLATLRARCEQQLAKHYRKEKLLDYEGKTLDLDTDKPLHFSSYLIKSDEDGSMVYYPKKFDKDNHGGKSKHELLNDESQPFPGFHVFLIKPDLTIPLEGSGTIVGARKDIETNKSSVDYLKLLKKPQYREEKGFTIEDSIALTMITLDQTNQIIDDGYAGKVASNLDIGNFRPVSDDVPCSFWDDDESHMSVTEVSPREYRGCYGVRVAVG